MCRFTSFAIAARGRTIAHQRPLENSRTESTDGISVAKREGGTSKIAAGDSNASEGFAANAIRSIIQ